MPKTPRRAAIASTNPMRRDRPGAMCTTFTPGAGSRVLVAMLVSAVLFAPVLATAQSSPIGTATPAQSEMAPTRMPRPGSSTTFERGESGHAGRKTPEQRFEDANTSHDGHLTEPQAQAAHMRGVASHFAEIDSHHRGYITLDEIRAWRAERRAERKAEREKAAK